MASDDGHDHVDHTVSAPGRHDPWFDYREPAQALAHELDTRDIHPVLVFGTGGSGKTVMLQSLLTYAQRHEEAGFVPNLDESVFPEGYPYKVERDRNAQNFYDNVLEAFHSGRLAGRTQLAEGPFFVPIIANVAGRLEPLRFAFLESMGEWYEREPTTNPTGPYQNLRWEIASLLATREKPISVIFVAPTVGIDNQTRDYSHRCIANAMRQYEKIRIAKQRDNVLLLVSKWDSICNPDDPRANFADATAKQAIDHVRNWIVWPSFCGIDGLRPGSRAFTPYSAARVNDFGMMTIGGDHAETFDQFNRTVWNWLYGNATEPPFSVRKRPVLYPEVMPRVSTRVPIHHRLIQLALHRGGPGGDELSP